MYRVYDRYGQDVIEKIKVPMLLNCVGMNVSKEVTEERKNKFKNFLDRLIEKDAFISVSDDGSYE